MTPFCVSAIGHWLRLGHAHHLVARQSVSLLYLEAAIIVVYKEANEIANNSHIPGIILCISQPVAGNSWE